VRVWPNPGSAYVSAQFHTHRDLQRLHLLLRRARTEITVSSAFGPAIGLVQPKPGVVDTVARELTGYFIGLLGNIDVATDVPDTGQSAVLQEMSA